jgi:hypothetical protein
MNKEELKKIENNNTPEAKNTETILDLKKEKEKKEKMEIFADEKAVDQELRRELDMMEMDENLKKEAQEKANKIQFYADDEKIKHLLRIAREKGIVFAIQTAKKMNDPYLLDVLHDVLAKEGYYKDFTK